MLSSILSQCRDLSVFHNPYSQISMPLLTFLQHRYRLLLDDYARVKIGVGPRNCTTGWLHNKCEVAEVILFLYVIHFLL